MEGINQKLTAMQDEDQTRTSDLLHEIVNNEIPLAVERLMDQFNAKN